MNLSQLKQAIEELPVQTYGNYSWFTREDVLSLLSEVTFKDVLKEVRCDKCSFYEEWEPIHGECKLLKKTIDGDFGCKYFKEEEK